MRESESEMRIWTRCLLSLFLIDNTNQLGKQKVAKMIKPICTKSISTNIQSSPIRKKNQQSLENENENALSKS